MDVWRNVRPIFDELFDALRALSFEYGLPSARVLESLQSAANRRKYRPFVNFGVRHFLLKFSLPDVAYEVPQPVRWVAPGVARVLANLRKRSNGDIAGEESTAGTVRNGRRRRRFNVHLRRLPLPRLVYNPHS